MAVCSRCGRQNANDARFCSGCAAPLVAEPTVPRAVRKTVTVVFSDVVDSTRLGELDPESAQRVMARWHAAMRAVLERYGGTVEKFVGDAVMAVFGVPVVHEDDALRAVRAAVEMRRALDALNAKLGRDQAAGLDARTAVNTGEVVAGVGETLVTGDAVNVAARLEQSAQAGEILLGEQTHRIVAGAAVVEPVEALALKGKAQPVRAWRLLDVLPDTPAFARPIATRFVGRLRELAALQAAFEQVVAEQHCELVTLLGTPGIGKSRLMREFVGNTGGRARPLVGRCLPYGEGITYWPLVEIVKEVAGNEPRAAIAELLGGDERAGLVADLVATAVGASERSGSTDETHWGIRQLFEALARDGPLIVVLEDLHWAAPTFLDLVEYIARLADSAPILFLGSARPELLEVRPEWAKPRSRAELLVLEPLREPEVNELITGLLAARSLSPDLRTRLIESAEGNPLFVEQLLALEAEEGAASGEVVVPPTLRALLAARIDRLGPHERAVIERASVEGRGFHRGAVTELLPPGERESAGAHLLALVRKELIRPDRSEFAGDDGFRFVHVLVRDAAYESMPKELRAELHERYADWLERNAAERMVEYGEIVGFHFEQAYRNHAELALPDERVRQLGARAAERLQKAGQRAFAIGNARAAVDLFRRADVLLHAVDGDRLSLLLQLGPALIDLGEFRAADDVLAAAATIADASRERDAAMHAAVIRVALRLRTDPLIRTEEATRVAGWAIARFKPLGDDRGLAHAWYLLAAAHRLAGRTRAGAEAIEQALTYARRAGDHIRELDLLAWRAEALYWGPTPVGEAINACRQILDEVHESPVNTAWVRGAIGALEAMQGRFEEARATLEQAQTVLEELDRPLTRATIAIFSGPIELLAGDAEAAERELRRACDALRAMREKRVLASVAARLAEALYLQERNDEAEVWLRISEQTAAIEASDAQSYSRGVRAKILARRGAFGAAQKLADEAVSIVNTTDNPNDKADILMSLVEVLRIGDRTEDAISTLGEAIDHYEQKGNVVSAAKARARVGELRAATR